MYKLVLNTNTNLKYVLEEAFQKKLTGKCVFQTRTILAYTKKYKKEKNCLC